MGKNSGLYSMSEILLVMQLKIFTMRELNMYYITGITQSYYQVSLASLHSNS